MSDWADDDMAVTTTEVVGAPAHNLHAHVTGESPSKFQCNSDQLYCFFCDNSAAAARIEEGDESDYNMLVDYVDHLVEGSQDLWHVAKQLQLMYDKAVRRHTITHNSMTGGIVRKPEWTLDAITIHLTSSRQWPIFRDSHVSLSLFNMFDADQKQSIDVDTGRTIDSTRKAALETAKAYIAFRSLEVKVLEAEMRLKHSRRAKLSVQT